MIQKNPTFRGAEPTWANACVGNNGQPGYIDYSTGFSKAANILIDKVLNDGSIHLSVDEFVYPVCFNMRHSVELRLKGAIDEIIEIAKIKNIIFQFNSSGSHDINSIWTYFKTKSEIIDERYIEINKKSSL
jgi:methionine synthase II (cobalamin-independent)